jgi:hypothetical protein
MGPFLCIRKTIILTTTTLKPIMIFSLVSISCVTSLIVVFLLKSLTDEDEVNISSRIMYRLA